MDCNESVPITKSYLVKLLPTIRVDSGSENHCGLMLLSSTNVQEDPGKRWSVSTSDQERNAARLKVRFLQSNPTSNCCSPPDRQALPSTQPSRGKAQDKAEGKAKGKRQQSRKVTQDTGEMHGAEQSIRT